MTEKLNGTTETVDFDVSSSVRFPQHWHIAWEIICPIEDIYFAIKDPESLSGSD